MEELQNIHKMSIAELRKILSDNDVSDANISSKDELKGEVINIILTKMKICELNDEAESEYEEVCCISDSLDLENKNNMTKLRKEQDAEYEYAVKEDMNADLKKDLKELSLIELREKRLLYFNKV
tara:strand:+ start:26 stop:400 length:375 start_codon:yes stop_codon:yes gene_type:complete